MTDRRPDDAWSGLGTGWAIVSTLIAGMLTGWLVGWLVDKLAGTDHVFVALGIVLGGQAAYTTSSCGTGKMIGTTGEPERELGRRVLPFVPLALVVAFVIGWVAGGPGSAWSAAIAVAIVAVNFVAFALSIAWAARISPTMLAVVALGGYVVRLII